MALCKIGGEEKNKITEYKDREHNERLHSRIEGGFVGSGWQGRKIGKSK